MGFLPFSIELQEIIVADIKDKAEKEYTLKIIKHFKNNGFTIKVKYMFPKKPTISYYRIFCFIKKNQATVVIDARKDIGLNVFVRIENKKTFDQLTEFTDNIREQIINSRDCPTPDSIDCKDKMYRFKLNGKEYIKCMSISCNFKFCNISKSDFTNIMDIIKKEINNK